jgi:hypothetical protein
MEAVRDMYISLTGVSLRCECCLMDVLCSRDAVAVSRYVVLII